MPHVDVLHPALYAVLRAHHMGVDHAGIAELRAYAAAMPRRCSWAGSDFDASRAAKGAEHHGNARAQRFQCDGSGTMA